MTVLFVPERIFRNSRQEGGLGAVEHLVGIELSSSSAVVATAVAQERQQAPHQLPAEVLQAVLDRIDPPHGWPRGSLRILAQTGAGLSTEAEGLECAGATASMRLCRRSNSAAAVIHSLVLFDPPNPSKHHFLAIDPIRLRFATNDVYSSEAHDDTRGSGGQDPAGLYSAIDLINAAHQVDLLIQTAVRQHLGLSSGEVKLVDVSKHGHRIRLDIQRGVDLVGGALLKSLDDSLLPGVPQLKDMSAFCHQVSLRTRQAVILSQQLSSLRRSIPPAREVAGARAAYIGFYNTIWLVLNDLIVGQALGRLIEANERNITTGLVWAIKTFTVETPLDLLVWLDDWPAGLKLNTELSAFASSALVALVRFWDSVVLDRLITSLPTILRLASFIGLLGSSALIALAADLLSVATAHLYVAYLGSTVTYRWMAKLLDGLFDVFRGKRRNVLRQRLDATSYSVDQLLVGTLLFTTLVFLFPTVLAYYALVASSRAAIVLAHATLETALACVNHWPLFAIMLRVKAPARLPGGIHVEPTAEPRVFRLRSKSLPMTALLKQHLLLSVRILSVHYSPIRLARAFVRGELVTPLSKRRTTGTRAD